jgi:hypothetical protein
MKSILAVLLSVFLLNSCSSEPKKEPKKEDETQEVKEEIRLPYDKLKAKVFYEGIRKEGTDKLYKFRVDSIGPDKITMYGVSLFGEGIEVSGLAMSATSDTALVYTIGDKLVVELFEGVANFFKNDQLTKTESFIKKEYKFDIKEIEETKKHKPAAVNNVDNNEKL